MLSATRYRGSQNYARKKSRKELPEFFSVLQQGLSHLTYKPLQTVLMLAILTILFMMPTSLWLVYKNIDKALTSWSSAPKILVYLNHNATDDDAKNLLIKIQGRSDIAKAVYISPSQGLSQFAEQMGQENLFASDSTKNLPGVIEVLPASNMNFNQIAQLNDSLKQLADVDSSYTNMNLIKQQVDTLGFWKFAAYVSVLFSGIAIFLSMIMDMQLLIAMSESRSVKTKTENTAMSFYASGVFLGLGSALLACLIAAVLLSNSSGYLSQWYNQQLDSVTSILVLKLVLVGMVMGGLGVFIAQQGTRSFVGRN